MEIKRALLLAAGMGTRMGNIGKILPKVLWPVFERTLLELQIKYLKSIGIEEIYINTHHCHEQIKNFVKKHRKEEEEGGDDESLFKNTFFIHEPTLLDIGGAIHNVASLKQIDYQGFLLVVNSDQFLCSNFKLITSHLKYSHLNYSHLRYKYFR
ncbi:MAG: NTP transferase domain-containing protein [Oligoflexia bacterium]|nr:NTP transferase domain-containing protein [Oligoflexia bacterium]